MKRERRDDEQRREHDKQKHDDEANKRIREERKNAFMLSSKRRIDEFIRQHRSRHKVGEYIQWRDNPARQTHLTSAEQRDASAKHTIMKDESIKYSKRAKENSRAIKQMVEEQKKYDREFRDILAWVKKNPEKAKRDKKNVNADGGFRETKQRDDGISEADLGVDSKFNIIYTPDEISYIKELTRSINEKLDKLIKIQSESTTLGIVRKRIAVQQFDAMKREEEKEEGLVNLFNQTLPNALNPKRPLARYTKVPIPDEIIKKYNSVWLPS
jgi:hypothetical protein